MKNSTVNENIVAFVVARLSSSRLPGKQLKKIGDRRIIDWTIENVKKSKFVNKIVIATTDEKDNRPLVDVAKEHKIDTFLYNGDINDVVGRLAKAAINFDADVPILISGDCPLIWTESLDKMIEKILQDKKLDAVHLCLKEKQHTIHEGMGVFRKKCWQLTDKLSDKPNLREHQFPIIGLKPEYFNTDCVVDDDIFYKVRHRMSVDTPADLKFMNVVYYELKNKDLEFNMLNVVELLLKKPHIMSINKDVHQVKIDEKTKKALFIVKTGDNLELFFDMAYDLTKKAVGVRFFSNNKELYTKIKNAGYGILENFDKKQFDFVIEG